MDFRTVADTKYLKELEKLWELLVPEEAWFVEDVGSIQGQLLLSSKMLEADYETTPGDWSMTWLGEKSKIHRKYREYSSTDGARCFGYIYILNQYLVEDVKESKNPTWDEATIDTIQEALAYIALLGCVQSMDRSVFWTAYDKSGRAQLILEAALPQGVKDPYVVLYDRVVEWCRAHPELIGRGEEKPTANDASRTSIADVFE